MTRETIYRDPFTGARAELDRDELLLTVPSSIVPQAQHSVRLDRDDIDRLAACWEHARTDAEGRADLADFFRDAEHMNATNSRRAADAFIRALDHFGG